MKITFKCEIKVVIIKSLISIIEVESFLLRKVYYIAVSCFLIK